MNPSVTKRLIIIILWTLLVQGITFGQPPDTPSLSLHTRFSFYSGEKSGEMLLHLPSALTGTEIDLKLFINGENVYSWKGSSWNKIIRLPFNIGLSPGKYDSRVEIVTVPSNYKKLVAGTDLIILNYKPNEVKTDLLTGGLIVNKRQFFPFGFYTYSPVYPTLPEEEVVKGFNVISPYQKIMPETLNDRKAYMDRCARLGMKVHYNLLSVSGGGGVGSLIEGISDEEKERRLVEEIITFMNHPALLAWYISDEPTGNKVPPEKLKMIYNRIKEIDPWHPVSIVFMAPFLSAVKYTDALDIVMADPYPVPNTSISMVGNVAGSLSLAFKGKKPVWIVPQAFGGGEWWKREPTIQEIRSMTYQSVVNGATGVQYFVRQGLNYFPKSTALWGECGRMATEIAELTPWLLSDETAPAARSLSSEILATSKLHDDQLIVVIVNRRNEPARAQIQLENGFTGRARVLFENRSINVAGGFIADHLPAYGSQVYLLELNKKRSENNTSSKNMMTDPGFEDLSIPGLPASCYARPGGDRGATYFTDSREHYQGTHSLRMITPQKEKSAIIRFFPFSVSAGKTYMISLWAKADPEQRPPADVKISPQYVEISVGDFSRARFVPDEKWRKYVTFVTISNDTLPLFKTNLFLKMPGEGVAWFDDIEVIEDVF